MREAEEWARAFVDVDPCPGHAVHRPTPLRLVRHHVVPLGWGGPNVASNIERCCDNCHYGAHLILEAFRRADDVLPRSEVRAVLGLAHGAALSRFMYDLARRGWTQWDAAGRPRVAAPIEEMFTDLQEAS